MSPITHHDRPAAQAVEVTPFAFPWFPDAGDGTYRNPILHADYSDPDVIRHGDDFWMTASSFNCTPGLPILHSKDLVNWTLVGHALQNLPHPRYASVQPGAGVWAPALRHHAGLFWIFFPMPDEGIFVTTAQHPAGPWCEPWCLAEAKGWIDPCPFWDDDGQAYLLHAWSMSRSGKKERIHLRPMSPDGRQLLGDGVELFHTPHHLYLEGPKIHKIDGGYYIFAPGGGVATGWQVVFRAERLTGPYEERVVLEQGSTPINGPHQGAMVELENGDWWFVHFQDAGAFGRITHLQPVTWRDGWPLIGQDFDGNGIGEPVARFAKPTVAVDPGLPMTLATTDEFDASTLRPQWQWQANHHSDWYSLAAAPGWLRLFAGAAFDEGVSQWDLSQWPRFLGQKFPARSFRCRTRLKATSGTTAGLAVVGGSGSAALAIRHTASGCELVALQGHATRVVGVLKDACVTLQVSVDPDGNCGFSTVDDGGAAHPVELTFSAQAGNWIGARVGLFAIPNPGAVQSGHADFDYLRFLPPDE